MFRRVLSLPAVDSVAYKDQDRITGELIRELHRLRGYNHRVRRRVDPPPPLLFAELSAVFVGLERFLRRILADADERDTLQNLLERASGRRAGRIVLADRTATIEKFVRMRDALLHAKLEDRARQVEPSGVLTDYMPGGFCRDLDEAVMFFDHIAQQVDGTTGQTKPPTSPLPAAPPTVPPVHPVSMVVELVWLRGYNKSFKPEEDQSSLLLVTEGSLALMLIERACREALGAPAPDGFRELLHAAVVARRVLTLRWDDPERGVGQITDVRNTLLHGNYEQAAAATSAGDVPTFFKTQFASEVEKLGQIALHFAEQVSG